MAEERAFRFRKLQRLLGKALVQAREEPLGQRRQALRSPLTRTGLPSQRLLLFAHLCTLTLWYSICFLSPLRRDGLLLWPPGPGVSVWQSVLVCSSRLLPGSDSRELAHTHAAGLQPFSSCGVVAHV